LYAVEKEAREGRLGPEARLALRQAKSVPLMGALKTRLVEIRQQIPPGGKLAQACDYALGQWSRLEEYLKDGVLEADTNWCYAAHGITNIMPTAGLCRVAAPNPAFCA
jgi:hypothetical protein